MRRVAEKVTWPGLRALLDHPDYVPELVAVEGHALLLSVIADMRYLVRKYDPRSATAEALCVCKS